MAMAAESVCDSLSVGDSSSVVAPRSVGRKKRSAVWKNFSVDTALDKSICQVKAGESEAVCGHHVSGKFPMNLKQH